MEPKFLAKHSPGTDTETAPSSDLRAVDDLETTLQFCCVTVLRVGKMHAPKNSEQMTRKRSRGVSIGNAEHRRMTLAVFTLELTWNRQILEQILGGAKIPTLVSVSL